ncbi:glycerol-3-phosphate ABC transporter, periplasmic glycerol-3-phosphate-binding protein [Geomicrobium sp. JCM 19037]|uniref:extracellular solute-binding protein n=1 Tax=Geomicrobium sp. JCM 19037 TaxID=1460634 RepID=UPI00045F441F|nr:extracellular solute-binding protein [Geomicrobium sp. JCM 19037]GAK02328.1 glycerol-3-phosphate ABC transporter, periplasmic glycerol-3-phosphate-binding protein [Geomicrobium sp. JCM 19037]
MMADIPEEVQEAAWEFVKYTVQPDVQAEWSAATGYFPVHTAAYNEPVLEELYEEFPQFLTSVEQLQNTTPSPATQGALMDAFPEVREQIMISLERMHEGMSAEDALNELESEINTIIN